MLFSVVAAEPRNEAETHYRNQTLARLALFLLNLLLLSLIVALISAGVWFLRKRDYLTRTYPLTVRVDNALGVDKGTPITYKGLQVGTVGKASLNGDSVALRLNIRQQYHFNRDARFVVTPALFNIPAGLQIAQKAGSDSPQIAPGTTDLTGETMLDPVASLTQADRVFRKLETTADRTDKLLRETTRTAANINALMGDRELQSSVKSTVRNVDQITRSSRRITEQAAGRMTKNVAETLVSLKSTAANLKQVTDRMNKASAATEKFVTNPAVLKSLGETMSDVKGITAKSNTLLEKLNQAPIPKK